ncbi:MAG: hypothetical protein WCL21_11075 [Mariniphaga sp.]
MSIFKGQEIKILDARLICNEQTESLNVKGTIVDDESCLHICCCDGKVLQVNTIFYNDCFVPAYNIKQWGLEKGMQLGPS